MALFIKGKEIDFIDGLFMYEKGEIGIYTLAYLWQHTEKGMQQDLKATFKYFENKNKAK